MNTWHHIGDKTLDSDRNIYGLSWVIFPYIHIFIVFLGLSAPTYTFVLSFLGYLPLHAHLYCLSWVTRPCIHICIVFPGLSVLTLCSYYNLNGDEDFNYTIDCTSSDYLKPLLSHSFPFFSLFKITWTIAITILLNVRSKDRCLSFCLATRQKDMWGGYFINWGHFNNHVKQIKLANTISFPKAFNVFFTVPSKICPGSIKLEQGCSSCILSVGMKYVIWCYFYQFFMPHYLCKYFLGPFFKSWTCHILFILSWCQKI